MVLQGVFITYTKETAMALHSLPARPDFSELRPRRNRPKRTELGRCLHLIDIENLVGTARPTAEQVASCRAEYESRFFEEGDIVVIAMNHGALMAVSQAWPDARHEIRSGPDGADLALLDVIKHERVADRFVTVIIASGDGIFTDAAAWLGRQGVMTIVVAAPESTANRLRLAATKTVELSTRIELNDELAS